MERIDANELWRHIPPEEKFDLINKAHAKGISAAAITIIVSATCAAGLQLSGLMWAGLLISPLIFQFTAAKAWRDLRPRLMLEYLAARSVARRFAFMRQSHALTPELIFRGEVEEQFDNDAVQEALEAIVSRTSENRVWIALFSDVVVMMSEKLGGARLEYSCPVDKKLEVRSESPSGKGDYASDKELYLTFEEPNKKMSTLKITSRHPAALVVFEKKLEYFKNPPLALIANELPEIIKEQLPEDEESFIP